jgi:hypothetical protein
MLDRCHEVHASTGDRNLSETPPRKAAWSAGKARRAVALAIGACALASTTAWASVYNPEHLAPAQISQIDAACQTTMGLGDSPTTQYDACAESLSHSFAARLKTSHLLGARQDCLARGLQPGTTALSECELAARHRQVAQAAQPVLESAAPTPRVKSYFSASVNEIRHRELRACAEIGYDPVSPGFGQCVGDLTGYMDEADHPVE